MVSKNTRPQEWFNLSNEEKALVSSGWNVYNNDGLEIIRAVYAQFRKRHESNMAIKNINFGVYHGGAWVIGVTVKWSSKDKVKLLKSYQGFVIQTFYDDAPDAYMRERAKEQFSIWFKEIKEKYSTEIQSLEEFKDIPEEKFYELALLMDGMSKYYNPFQEKKYK